MLRPCDLKVRDVMTSPPETIHAETTLAEAYLVLSHARMSGAPIVDPSGRLVGVFSTTDLLTDLAPILDPASPPDGAVLERIKAARLGDRVAATATATAERPPGLVTCAEDASLVEACRLMIRNRVHRVIVVDARRAPVAVLSAIDVVRAVAALDEVRVGQGARAAIVIEEGVEEDAVAGGAIEQDRRPGL